MNTRLLAWLSDKEPVIEVGEDNETEISDMSCHCWEYFGKDSGGSCYAKREHSIENGQSPYESEESVSRVNVYMKVGVLHAESHKQRPFIKMGL